MPNKTETPSKRATKLLERLKKCGAAMYFERERKGEL